MPARVPSSRGAAPTIDNCPGVEGWPADLNSRDFDFPIRQVAVWIAQV